MLERAKQLANGAQTLGDWLGAGGEPAAKEVAQARADVCAKCPLNADKWQFTTPVAEAILEQTRLRTHLELKVSNESSLGTCAACGCHLPLKVWVPLPHIKEYTSDEILKKLNSVCWVKNEKSDK